MIVHALANKASCHLEPSLVIGRCIEGIKYNVPQILDR
jgi:hypothetical protein